VLQTFVAVNIVDAGKNTTVLMVNVWRMSRL